MVSQRLPVAEKDGIPILAVKLRYAKEQAVDVSFYTCGAISFGTG